MRPLSGSYDVCVAGGGFAGLGAAVRSARLGLKTLLVEKNSGWGGAASSARHHFLCGLYASGGQELLNPGLSSEVERFLISEGQAKVVRMGKVPVLAYPPLLLQPLFAKLTAGEQALDVLLDAGVSAVTKEGAEIKGLYIQHKNERVEVKCRAVIDCSGGGEVIRLSGASYEIAPEGERQLAAFAFEIGGVRGTAENLQTAYHLAKAVEAGMLTPHLRFSVWMPGEKGQQGTLRMAVLPSDEGYDLDAIKAQARQVHHVLKERFEPFKDSTVIEMAGQVSEREGLRMCGLYTLSEEEVLNGEKFNDGAVKGAWPVEFWDQVQGPRYRYLKDGNYYEIPRRCLRSKNIANLFAAGKCISVSAKALASTRVTGLCLALGEQSAESVFSFLHTAETDSGKHIPAVPT